MTDPILLVIIVMQAAINYGLINRLLVKNGSSRLNPTTPLEAAVRTLDEETADKPQKKEGRQVVERFKVGV